MKITTPDGYEVEVEIDVRTGFTVHNQDGTSAIIVKLNPRIVDGPPTRPGGPGEPLPKPKAS